MEERIPKGIFLPKNIVQFVESNRKYIPEKNKKESFSNAYLRLYPELQSNCSAGNSLDTAILKKMIPLFIEMGIAITTTTKDEDARLTALIQEVMLNA